MYLSLALACVFLGYLLVPWSPKFRYGIAAALTVGTFLLFLPGVQKNHQLQKHGIETTGILLQKDCSVESYPKIRYSFQVDGKVFLALGRPGGGNRACKRMQQNDQVFLTYLASDPDVSVPERHVESMWVFWLFSHVGMFFFLVYMNRLQGEFLVEKKLKKRK